MLVNVCKYPGQFPSDQVDRVCAFWLRNILKIGFCNLIYSKIGQYHLHIVARLIFRSGFSQYKSNLVCYMPPLPLLSITIWLDVIHFGKLTIVNHIKPYSIILNHVQHSQTILANTIPMFFGKLNIWLNLHFLAQFSSMFTSRDSICAS